MKNTKLWNLIFVLTVCIPYITMVVFVYFDAGFYDWNFRNTLCTANVSPFMFTFIPFIFVFPKNIRKHLLLLVSLLSVGMFISSVLGCVYNFAIAYKFHPHFVLDYISHFALSLWGVYIIKSEQSELNFKNALISSSVIFSVSIFMLILNLICNTSFFGLSLTGKHNIYNYVLVDNSYLSALLYFMGLGVVLFLGYVYQYTILKIRSMRCCDVKEVK
jgi:hypothetical protein